MNGHDSWDHWNVSLWINNDESLYKWALSLSRQFDAGEAARRFIEDMHELGITETPDGAAYTLDTVRAVLEDME